MYRVKTKLKHWETNAKILNMQDCAKTKNITSILTINEYLIFSVEDTILMHMIITYILLLYILSRSNLIQA